MIISMWLLFSGLKFVMTRHGEVWGLEGLHTSTVWGVWTLWWRVVQLQTFVFKKNRPICEQHKSDSGSLGTEFAVLISTHNKPLTYLNFMYIPLTNILSTFKNLNWKWSWNLSTIWSQESTVCIHTLHGDFFIIDSAIIYLRLNSSWKALYLVDGHCGKHRRTARRRSCRQNAYLYVQTR